MTNLNERLKAAIEEGRKARAAYYASIEIEDEQALGEPCAPSLVEQLEQKLGRALPPSYRAFLLLHNGWKQVDGELDLLPIEDLLEEANELDVASWRRSVAQYGDTIAARCLVIGASIISPTKYLLDPERVNEEGEWLFLQYHHEVEAEVPSFLEWLEQSVDEYRELAESGLDEEELIAEDD